MSKAVALLGFTWLDRVVLSSDGVSGPMFLLLPTALTTAWDRSH